MLQGPPLNHEQQAMQAFLESLRANAEELRKYVVENNPAETLKSLTFYVKNQAAKRKISLNDEQILLILSQANTTVDQVIALKTKTKNPNWSLAIRIASTLAISTISPQAAGNGISVDATRELLHRLLDNKLGIYKEGIDIVCGLDFVASLHSNYSIRGIGGAAAQHVFEQYGKLGYIVLPLAILLYSKGPDLLKQLDNIATSEAAMDLVDMMGGVADDETYEKYRGTSLATMTIEDMASNVGRTATWLWNKLPAIRSQAPVQTHVSTAEQALPRLN